MLIKDLSDKGNDLNALYLAWNLIPAHWQRLIMGLPCTIFIQRRNSLQRLRKKREKELIYILDPGTLVCVLYKAGPPESFEIRCCSSADYYENEVGKDYKLQKCFLMGVALSLYRQYPWIAEWLKGNISESFVPAFGMERFFIDTFPRYAINQKWLAERKEEAHALIMGLDAAVMLRPQAPASSQ